MFLDCRHGHLNGHPHLRRCDSPKLAGLKFVSPEQCASCFCRDHALDANRALPVLATRPLACAHLLTDQLDPSSMEHSVSSESASHHESVDTRRSCSHPRWGRTTLAQCQTCPDYLFPVATPRMPVELVRRLIELPPRQQSEDWWRWDNVQQAHRDLITDAIESVPSFPNDCQGRGLVVVGGGKYFVSAYVTIRVLRQVGCQLPIELWHLQNEVDDELRAVLRPLGVRCMNADEVVRHRPFRFLDQHWWKGWQLKAFALQNCSFREVLLLDADSYPARNPEFLFDWPKYREWGAIFWPDLKLNTGMIPEDAWKIFGVKPFGVLPTESGQVLINKELCWRELSIAARYNEHADFVYRILYGDKDTFPMAWHRLGRRYARMWPHSTFESVAIRQFDEQGQTLFLHRVHDKFRIPNLTFKGTPQRTQQNRFHEQFPWESFCFRAVHELASMNLKSQWLNPT